MKFSLKSEDISNQSASLVNFHERFKSFFQTRTRSMAVTALDYFKGILTVDTEKNMAEMNSPWDDELLIE